MTTHYLICKNCGHAIPGSSPEELTAEPRRCPSCDSAAWDFISGPLFPCRSRERETIYKKILHIVRWCAENDQPCRTHSGCCPLAKHHCTDGTSIPGAVFDWIMGVEV